MPTFSAFATSGQRRFGQGSERGRGAVQVASTSIHSEHSPQNVLPGGAARSAIRAKSGAKPVVKVIHHAAANAAALASNAAYKLARWGGIANDDIAGVAGVAGVAGNEGK